MFEKGNIIKIASINKEGMIMGKAKDIYTGEINYIIYEQDNDEYLYFVKENDIIFIDTIEDSLCNLMTNSRNA